MAKAAKARPAPRIIEPKHPNSPRYYEWDSESEPGRNHRVMVFRGEVKGCTCRGARHGCWHKREAERLEALAQEENVTNQEVIPYKPGQVAQPPQEVRVYQSSAPQVIKGDEYNQIMKIAGTIIEASHGEGGSDMVPANIKTPHQALAVMLAGYEFGFPPFAALRQVFIVNGKTQLMSEGLNALLQERGRRDGVQIEWHERSSTGAEATLHRAGQYPLRIRYDEEDRARAHQGERRAGPRKWLPKLGNDGKQLTYPAGHKRAGEGQVMLNPAYDENNPGGWELDPDSPWAKYPKDMYAWAVLKRLARFGAPDLTNLQPRLPGDDQPQALPGAWTREEDELEPRPPVSQLTQAVYRGEVDPAAADQATEVPDLEGDPDVPPEPEPEEEPESPDVPEETAEPVVREMTEDEANAHRKALYDKLAQSKKDMLPTAYTTLAVDIMQRFMPQGSRSLDLNKMSGENAMAALREVLIALGESDGSDGPPLEVVPPSAR